jgi:formiminotetrahydrofolate cyclodeaminase
VTELARRGAELARDLLDTKLRDLLERVAGESRFPTAGPVAALVVALAAGLVAMAARRSRDGWTEAAGAAAQAQALRTRALPLAGLDAAAYAEATRLLELPPSADISHRDFKLAQALKDAAEIPLLIAEAAADVAELGRVVAERSEGSVRGEAVSGAVLARAAAQAGMYLVEINLSTTPDDPRLAAAQRAATLAEQSAAAALALERAP